MEDSCPRFLERKISKMMDPLKLVRKRKFVVNLLLEGKEGRVFGRGGSSGPLSITFLALDFLTVF